MTLANETARASWRLRGARWWEAVRAARVPPALTSPTRSQVVAWALITLASLGLALFRFHSLEFGLYHDDAVYVILARSLLEAGPYGLIHLPGEPGPPTFPFGYPLLLAGALWLNPGDYAGLKLISLAATTLNLGLMFWGWPWLSRTTSRWWGVAVAACYGFSPLVISHARLVMSEAVFLTLGLLVCLAAARLSAGRAGPGGAAAIGFALVGLCSIRAVGVAFALGPLADVGLVLGRRALRPLLLAGAAGASMLALILLLTPVSASDVTTVTRRYATELSAFVDGSGRHAQNQSLPYHDLILQRAGEHLVEDLRAVILPVGGGSRERAFWSRLGAPFIADFTGLAIGLLAVAGGLRGLQREAGGAFATAALTYSAVIVFWNWTSDRMLYPIVPQLFWGFLLGVDGLIGFVQHAWRNPGLARLRRPFLVVAGSLLVATLAIQSLRLTPSEAHIGSLARRTAWIAANTELESVVLSETPFADFLYSRRHTVSPPPTSMLKSSAATRAYLAAHRVDYVLVAPSLEWRESYAPSYDPDTLALKQALDLLTLESRAALVHAEPPQGLFIYQVFP